MKDSKRPRKFTLIKRQADEPTIVIFSDWGWKDIPFNKLIEVEESSRSLELQSRIEELEEKLLKLHNTVDYWANAGLIESYSEVAKSIGTSLGDVMDEISEALSKIKGEG